MERRKRSYHAFIKDSEVHDLFDGVYGYGWPDGVNKNHLPEKNTIENFAERLIELYEQRRDRRSGTDRRQG